MLMWSLFLAALPPQPPAITAPAAPPSPGAPPPCPTPSQYSYTDWELSSEDRWYQDEWVMQRLQYSRTRTDKCRDTSERETRTEGPFRLWQAVPDRRVADVNHPDGSSEGVTGSPLRSSDLPALGQPASVGPNPAPVQNRAPGTTPSGGQPAPAPFFPGIPLLVGALVYGLVFRRRSRKNDPVAEHTQEPVQGPPIPELPPRPFASLPEKGEWLPAASELAWLQAFFGIAEHEYGPLTQAAVKRLQEKYQIPPDGKVMIGPKTYRALWQEHINLVHATWQKLADGDHPVTLDRVLDSPMPPDLRAELAKLNDAYASYWSAVEGRYQAILRRDPVLVAEYDRELALARDAGLKVDEIGMLTDRYQPLVDALYKQAETVKSTADDGEYAQLLAMLAAADAGKWEEIKSVQATWSGRWDAFWTGDATESDQAGGVVDFVSNYVQFSVKPPRQVSKTAEAPSEEIEVKATEEWLIPRQPYNIENPVSDQEKWLAIQIQRLNSGKVQEAAEFFVRNAAVAGLKYDVNQVIRDLTWDQTKINQTWQYGLEKGVDPRFLLAIIVHEGTGSFNTNSKVKTGRGTPGPDPDFDQDLRKALDGHVGQKLRAYGQYGEAFREAVLSSGIPGDGSLFQYINYPAPADDRSGNIWVGGYATDVDWWSNGGDGGVLGHFRELTNLDGPAEFEAYLRNHPPVMNTAPEKRPKYEFHASWAGATASDECVLAPHQLVRAYLPGTYDAKAEPKGPYIPDPSKCR